MRDLLKAGDIIQVGTAHPVRVGLVVAMPAIVLAMAALVPFIHKAFTIDDVTFLLQAQHILADPLHPTAFDMVFHGQRIRISDALVTGPVMGFLLIPSVLLEAEWPLHLFQLAFLVLAAIGTAAIALRLSLGLPQAALAALLVVASPAVLAMATTGMPDVTAMCFAVLGMERVMAWRSSLRWQDGLLASVLLTLAALSRPQTLLLLGCAALYLIPPPMWQGAFRERLRGLLTRNLLPVVISLLLLGGINYVMRDPQSGRDLAGATVSSMNLKALWVNLANFPLQWTVAFPLTFLWLSVKGWRSLRSARTAIGSAIGVVVAVLAGYAPLAPFVALGTVILLDIVGEALEQCDQVQVMLASWLLIAVTAAPYAHLPAKFLVPSAPAMALLIARLPAPSLRSARPMLATMVVVGLLLGILVARADAALAEIGRIGGKVVRAQVASGHKVWLDGGWGFQWYAMQAGAEPLATTAPFPRRGDRVVAGHQAWLVYRYEPKKLVSRQVFSEPGGRIFGNGAGFYASGPFPWVWGAGELARLEVWELE